MTYNNFLLFIIAILIILLINKNNIQQNTIPMEKTLAQIEIEKNKDSEIDKLKQQVMENKIRTEVIQDNQDAKELRYNRVHDPLTAPERSYPFMMNRNKVPINIETRGKSMEYQQIGFIHSEGDDDNKIIYPLYGKQLWRGSSKWSYYTGTDKMHQIKLPIVSKNKQCMDENGCDELYDNDSINVPPFNNNFKVQIYNLDAPKYIPL